MCSSVGRAHDFNRVVPRSTRGTSKRFLSSMVEHMAVNHGVLGSSPRGGAINARVAELVDAIVCASIGVPGENPARPKHAR